MTEPTPESVPLRYDHLPATHFIHRAEMRTLTPPASSGVDAMIEIDVTDDTTNRAGGLQGGRVATLIDCAAGSAVRHRVGSENGFATQDLVIHYLAAVRQGPARAIARIRKAGGRAVIVQVEVVDRGDGERLCALGTATFVLLGERRSS